MSWRRQGCLVFLLAALSFLTGCLWPKTATDPKSGLAVLLIEVDWSELDRPKHAAIASSNQPLRWQATSVGARLVYANENATFMQAVSKEAGRSKDTITMEVPPAAQADLYLAVVDAENEVALAYALIRDLTLQSGTVQYLTTDDFAWIDAEWYIEEEYSDALAKREFRFPTSNESAGVFVYVRDPFQEGRPASYETSLIGCRGTSSMMDNTDGWLGFHAFVKNPFPGTPNTSINWLQPCLDGIHFNLGNRGYAIPPVVEKVTVIWE